MAAKTVTRDSSESDARWMLGGLYEIKVSSDETGGAMTASAPPPIQAIVRRITAGLPVVPRADPPRSRV